MRTCKYLVIVTLILTMPTGVLAKSPPDRYVLSPYEGGWVYPSAMAVDDSGNVFVAGGFYSTVDFGGGLLASAGFDDIFLAKFDSDGDHLWSHCFGDEREQQYVMDIALDYDGNVIITGYFNYGEIDFGGGPLGYGAFYAKFDADGNHLRSESYSNGAAASIAVDQSNNFIITGEFSSSIDFGGEVLTSVDIYDIFIVKFDPNGNHIWSYRHGGSQWPSRKSISIDVAENLILSGYFSNNIDFGCGPLTTPALDDYIFIAKMDSAVNCLWSDGYETSLSMPEDVFLTIDNSGSAIITGQFIGTLNFGGTPLISAGSWDFYVAKFDTGGNHQWSNSFGSTEFHDRSHAITTDKSDNIIITGNFENKIDFGGDELTGAGYMNVFLAKFTHDGNHLWSKSYGDSLGSTGRCVAAADAKNIFTAGFFEDNINLGGDTFWNFGDCDMYIAKLDSIGNHIWSKRFGNWISWEGVGIDDSHLKRNLEFRVYPNPFNPHTTISFTVPIPTHTILKVYDVKGKLVRTLLNERKIPGKYRLMWDGSDANHLPVASGIYFVRLEIDGFSTTKKIVHIK